MVSVHEDSVFYGVAAEMAGVCQAVSRSKSPTTANAILRRVSNVQDEQTPPAEETTLDPVLLELENLMIREFFSSPFVYQPLDGPKAIRVLVLHPGSPWEPLRGTVQHTVVLSNYEAISYTWGSDSKPCFILIDGCQMPLTHSLFNALVRLRYLHRDRKLWADDLCINQSDNKEKGIQVALMPAIYTHAAKVLVHLGVQADGSEHLPELLEKVGKIDTASIRERGMRPEEFVSNGLPPPDDRAWEALVAFFCRPWFLRIWVIQEAVLAREIRFLCGDWELKWRFIADMAEGFDALLLNTIYGVWTEEFKNAQQAAASLAFILALRLTRSGVAERLDHLRRDIELMPRSNSDRITIERLVPDLAAKREFIVQACREHATLFPALERTMVGLDVVTRPSTPIIKLLGMFARNEATKPQDRLYALIGLAADINLEEFPPDYEETVAQTNARFGRKLVEKGQGMDLLFHATKLSIELRDISFPSWTPDWSPRRSMESHWLKLGWAYTQYSGGFHGRGPSTSYVSLADPTADVLKVSGFRLDSFHDSGSIVKLFDDLDQFKASRFGAASKQFFQRTAALMNGDPYFTGESWPEVQCRTLIGDHINGVGKSLSEAIDQYEETKRNFINPPHDDRQRKSPNAWGNAWFRLLPEYALCRTTRGYAGLVPEATAATDEVFMLHGSDLPFVLRPIRSLPGYYRFVGGCYIHGLMRGEAWKLEKTPSEYLLI